MAEQHPHVPAVNQPKRLIRFGRSRFSWLLLSLMMVVSVGLGTWQLRVSLAADSTTVSGRVTDATTGYGIPNITLSLCHDVNVVTNANGEWSIALPQYSSICVLYASGAPSTVSATSAVNLPATAKVRNLYEYQVTGINCYQNTTDSHCYLNSQSYDRAVDTGYDMTFTLATPYKPAATPAPAQAATPTPAPKATLTPTPAAGAPGQTRTPLAGTPTPASKAASGSTAADHQPPPAPASFTAVAAPTNALVSLGWKTVSVSGATISYDLERSSDGAAWTPLAPKLAVNSYQDDTVIFGVTYTYRLRAMDSQGNVSNYVTVSVKTAEFVNNTRTDAALSYTSDDGAATIYALSGTFVAEAQCSVTLGGWNNLHIDAASAILAGPYQFLCKDARGQPITAFHHAVRWTITPRRSDLKLSSPQLYRLTASGRPQPLSPASYDAKTRMFVYLQSTNDRVIVLASQQSSPLVVFAIIGMTVLVLGIATLTIISLQRKRLHHYRDYLRDKYYNL